MKVTSSKRETCDSVKIHLAQGQIVSGSLQFNLNFLSYLAQIKTSWNWLELNSGWKLSVIQPMSALVCKEQPNPEGVSSFGASLSHRAGSCCSVNAKYFQNAEQKADMCTRKEWAKPSSACTPHANFFNITQHSTKMDNKIILVCPLKLLMHSVQQRDFTVTASCLLAKLIK